MGDCHGSHSGLDGSASSGGSVSGGGGVVV